MYLTLGLDGPVLLFITERLAETIDSGTGEDLSVTQFIQHYFNKSRDKDVGEHTLFFRRAFERV